MENTASKNEMNVEASQIETLPLLRGSLRPWRKNYPMAVGTIAKFTPKDVDPDTRWIPGMTFQVRTADVLRTLVVERYMEPREVPARVIDSWPGKRDYSWEHVPAHTIPGCVVVRIIRAVEVR